MNSDVDFLIVDSKPFGPERSRRKEMARIWRALGKFMVPEDILLYTHAELESRMNSAGCTTGWKGRNRNGDRRGFGRTEDAHFLLGLGVLTEGKADEPRAETDGQGTDTTERTWYTEGGTT